MKIRPRIILRADGDSQIGLGHIFRVMAFSAFLKEEFNCVFCIQDPSESIKSAIINAACELIVLPYNTKSGPNLANEILPLLDKDDIVILDGYHFDFYYQNKIKEVIGCKILSIDDIYKTRFVSDVVLNHIGGITVDKYQISPATELYLGPEHAILRKEFYLATNRKKERLLEQNLFINFGGADPQNHTLKILNEIKGELNSFSHVFVVVGGAYAFTKELESFCISNPNVVLQSSLSVTEMLLTMQKATVAICSASTIAYEYCTVNGLLFVVQTADNQMDMIHYLIESGLALPYNSFISTIHRRQMEQETEKCSLIQQRVFDGKAPFRLVQIVKKLLLKENLISRNANPGDVDLYFDWANDKDVRINSFNSEMIRYEDHCRWFSTRLSDSDSDLYVFTTKDGIPVGNVRFHTEGNTSTLSYLIDKKFRGIGLAKDILSIATIIFFEKHVLVEEIKGFVKNNNIPSIKAFRTVGYDEVILDNNSSASDTKCFTIQRDSYKKYD